MNILQRLYLFACDLIMAVFKDDNSLCSGDCEQGRRCDCCRRSGDV